MRFNDKTVLFAINSIPVIGNFTTGSLIGLTPEGETFCKDVLDNGVKEIDVKKENEELFQALVCNGFFSEEPANEIKSAYLHVTQRCNLHCVGCYSLDSNRNLLKDPTIEQIKRAIEQLSVNDHKIVVISGGEPFLRDDLEEIARYAKEDADIKSLHIITNGMLVTSEKVKAVKPYVDKIAVSIDGYDEEHPTFIRDEGIFDKLIHAVQICKETGVDTNILPTIHTKNYDHMQEYVELSKKLGTGISYSLLTCSPKDDTLKNWLPTEEQLTAIADELVCLGLNEVASFQDLPIGEGVDTRNSCGVGNKIISIGADGSVYPCHMLHDPRLVMGNVYEEDLNQILTCELANECRNLHVDSIEVCQKCRHRYICGGGCRARSYYVHGKITSHDFYCPMTMRYFDWVTDELEKLYG